MKKYFLLFILALIFQIYPVFAKDIAFSQNEIYAIKNEKGKILVPFNYSNISGFNDGFYLAKPAPLYAVYNKNGQKVASFNNLSIEYYGDKFIIVRSGPKYALADKTGKIISKKLYDYIEKTPNGSFIEARNGELIEILNTKGEIIVPTLYEGGVSLYDNTVAVRKNGKYYILDSNSKVKEEISYEKYNNKIKSSKNDPYKYIQKNKNIPYFDFQKNKWGIKDTYERMVIEAQYEAVYTNMFSDFYSYKVGRLWGVKDYRGNVIISPKYYQMPLLYGEYIYLNTADLFHYIDKNYKVTLKINDQDTVEPFNENLAAAGVLKKAKDGSYKLKYGYIDKKGSLVIEHKFDYARSFSNNVAVVSIIKNKEKKPLFGLINKKGKYVFKPIFMYLEDFKGMSAYAYYKNKQVLIDNKGNFIKRQK